MGHTSRVLAFLVGWVAVGCSAADDRVDPADLELRDLLGLSPSVANGWDEAQRAAAREVLADGLAQAPPADVGAAALGSGRQAEA
ncbi:MAG TPA: hypothetical protein VHE35_04230, partial [Kofleriaceae bacterium]|nr:hypothetical protein [Kofleriaceae bacterium]